MTTLEKKKVLLRERKRHTVRRVASTFHAVPVVGAPPPPACPDLGPGMGWEREGQGEPGEKRDVGVSGAREPGRRADQGVLRARQE